MAARLGVRPDDSPDPLDLLRAKTRSLCRLFNDGEGMRDTPAESVGPALEIIWARISFVYRLACPHRAS